MRVHVIGASGAGKSTLAASLGKRLRLPVHDLDPIAFVDDRWTPRPLPDRLEAVEAILRQPGWITEGGHLGWTEPLLDAADVIVWLDVPLGTTLRRRARGLRDRPWPFRNQQTLWQVRWYLRPYRKRQDLDRLPGRAAVRHFLKPRAAKVRRYSRNPSVETVLAALGES